MPVPGYENGHAKNVLTTRAIEAVLIGVFTGTIGAYGSAYVMQARLEERIAILRLENEDNKIARQGFAQKIDTMNERLATLIAQTNAEVDVRRAEQKIVEQLRGQLEAVNSRLRELETAKRSGVK